MKISVSTLFILSSLSFLYFFLSFRLPFDDYFIIRLRRFRTFIFFTRCCLIFLRGLLSSPFHLFFLDLFEDPHLSAFLPFPFPFLGPLRPPYSSFQQTIVCVYFMLTRLARTLVSPFKTPATQLFCTDSGVVTLFFLIYIGNKQT